MSVDYVAFGIIVDDIVFPDGTTRLGELGGGGTQAAFGMRLWSDRVGIVAGVGDDLPGSDWEWLDRAGIDRSGIQVSDQPTPRAWQTMEAGGRRTQSWRVPGTVVAEQLNRSLGRLPPTYRQARGFHFGIHPEQPGLEFTRSLRRLGSTVSVEPFKPADQPPAPALLTEMLEAAQIFSPNLIEAASLFGSDINIKENDQGFHIKPVRALTRALAQAGAQVVALRMGAEGSLVFDSANGKLARIPAYPSQVVDPLGAGNAYCGGFLVGWNETSDIVTAGLYGAVAASFLVETIGTPQFSAALQKEAISRLERLQSEVVVETL